MISYVIVFKDEPIARGGDGSFGARRMFKCPPNHGIFTQLTNVVKQDDFFFANPGKTFLILFSTCKSCNYMISTKALFK